MTEPIDAAHAERIWEGDQDAARRSYDRYLNHPTLGNLMRAVSDLYGQVRYHQNAQLLLELREDLADSTELYTDQTLSEDDVLDAADRLETASEILWWISRSKDLPKHEAAGFRNAAGHACAVGLRYTDRIDYTKHPRHAHTPYLLMLTAALIRIDAGDLPGGRALLKGVAEHDHGPMKDACQRSRVYRKLGMIERRTSRPLSLPWRRGALWGVRACLVRDIPTDVRKKGVGAFLPRAVLARLGYDL